MDVFAMSDLAEVSIIALIVAPIIYPIWGGVMYSDPWKWPLKDRKQ